MRMIKEQEQNEGSKERREERVWDLSNSLEGELGLDVDDTHVCSMCQEVMCVPLRLSFTV